jgi:hypothetical protein
MKTIQDYKKETILDKMYIYSEGTMSRRDYIILQKNKGFKCIEKIVKDYPKMEKLEIELKRNAFNIPFGNTSHPKTIEYNNKKQLLKDGIFKTVYHLECENYASIITKTEFDFFQSLNN